MNLGLALREARVARGLGQRELASLAGLSSGYLSLLERNLTAPPAEPKLRQLAVALGLDGDTLVIASGRIPSDVTRALINRPDLLAQVRAAL